VTGDFTVRGNLTAQQFILSSSVTFYTESFSSGSTRFGDSMDDTMVVTGSLRLTGSMGIGVANPSSLVEISKGSNAGSGASFPRLAIKNTLATQGDGSSTFNFADILVSSGNEAVNMFLATTYAAGTWAPAGIINVSTNHDLQIKTNNTTRLTIASTGAATFASSVTANGLYANAGNSARFYRGANDYYWQINSDSNNFLNFGTYFANGTAYGTNPKILLHDNGNVGIGTTDPQSSLHIYSTNATAIIQNSSTSTVGNISRLFFRSLLGSGNIAFVGFIDGVLDSTSANTGYLKFHTYNNGNADERMRITPGGNVLIGTTSNVGQKVRIYQSTTGEWNVKCIQPNGSDQKFIEFLTTTDSDATTTARGNIYYNGTNVLYIGTSDYRLKEDLQEYNGLSIVSQLKTYDFKWKEAGTRDYGMMAHELQEVLPNYVSGEKDAINEDGSIKPQGVDYSKIVPILIKSIQELKAEIDELKNK
jgi:hypothetical protein